jgi:hypothetical protein
MDYWLGVVQREHVLRGVGLGIAQLNHGAKGPVRRMSPGDGFVYYSPKTAYPEGDPLREFTAIGVIGEGEAYQDDTVMYPGRDFRPWRRKVDYVMDVTAAPIAPLLDVLELTRGNRNWGLVMRRGHVQLTKHDFDVIADSMGAASLVR